MKKGKNQIKETFDVKIIDITGKEDTISISARVWLRCPRKCKCGQEYLEKVVPIGLQNLVIVNKTVVGTT